MPDEQAKGIHYKILDTIKLGKWLFNARTYFALKNNDKSTNHADDNNDNNDDNNDDDDDYGDEITIIMMMIWLKMNIIK